MYTGAAMYITILLSNSSCCARNCLKDVSLHADHDMSDIFDLESSCMYCWVVW